MNTKVKLLTSLVISNIFLLEPSYALSNVELKKIDSIKLNTKEDINKLFELGSKAYEEQRFEEAIIYFKKIVEKFPGYGDAHYYLGLCQFSLGKYSLSIASFIDANKIFGTSKYDAIFGIGLSYLSLGYQDEARNYFRKVVNLSNDPDLVNDAQ
ncbi:MAG: tetratricopeptide repeat protein, partial [Candidatus Sericytochromatia bacterium]